ncbi:glycosyltransferase [Methylomonas koyamae]|uniref:glycosyltransferase n=1 Tax=Methylomonas koyamae TaxID=702114 RepID=UPI000A5AFFE5|nr:glycosyltransferase [Methylomonas koyamae]BBL57797.1 PGL/p-HBAD biosynthesis glycosyltransferase [Methylomonas koyamae]
MIRILFFAEAVTLAHVARCISIANKLHEQGKYYIGLASDARFDKVVGETSCQRIPLYSVSSEFFAKRLATGMPVYDVETLSKYVDEDVGIINQFHPDFIFGDFRLSLAISSKLTKIPYATITNAYWSPYANISYPVPELLLTRFFGVNFAQLLFDIVRPAVFKCHSLALNITCIKYGLQPFCCDMRDAYTHADYTLYSDIESLVPMHPLPKNHMFIGPVLWSVQVPLPDWWALIPDDRPIIFVSLGSSGDKKLLPLILQTTSRMPVTTICATASKSFSCDGYPNVFVSDFLPAEEVVEKANIVICNGGSPMVYQSLIKEKAVIGIPANLDQYLMMTITQKTGKGMLIRSGKLNATALENAINESLKIANQSSWIDESSLFSIEKIENIINEGVKEPLINSVFQ